MKPESLITAVELAEKLEHVFVATVDPSGMPHVATAGKLSQTSEDQVTCSCLVLSRHINQPEKQPQDITGSVGCSIRQGIPTAWPG